MLGQFLMNKVKQDLGYQPEMRHCFSRRNIAYHFHSALVLHKPPVLQLSLF